MFCGVNEVLGEAFIAVELDDCVLDNIDKTLDFFLSKDAFEAVTIVFFFQNCFLAGVDWIFLDFCEFFLAEVLSEAALATLGKFNGFLLEEDRGFLNAF